MKRRIWLTLVLMSGLSLAHAQAPVQRPPGLPDLEVVADHGGEPTRRYFAPIGGAGVSASESYSPQIGVTQRRTQPFSEADMLPVASERLTPGTVTPRELQLPGGFTPIFLIGDDALSRDWLAQRGDILRDMNAVGLVVQVQDEPSLQALRAEAEGLELRPVSGDGLAGRLGLQHYPVLISARGLEQ
ncbi:MAG: integrating conjugative element protein [Salinicola sp.]|nr:integrating conjugative element protein [Salinicola sp.]